LDEATAAEARQAAGLEEGQGAAGDDEPMIIDGEGGAEGDGDAKQAEVIGSKLKAKYAAKVVDNKAGKGKGKKKEEVGPSGQTYTPLEKQFMEIKKDYPDALLMMEGELSEVNMEMS
jgi:DNA mismatch repair protein MSH3